ncbi:NAD(P)H-hydrate dehydratase [Glaciecola sp. XM2]|jgi:NAD(P)H-hydrate epimerase|uniref:NAD(P)H-hydrate dehydratase n=1 Tax=Glaciecola sp. XM2 TaxID=1914931 RepID=UPI001BDE0AF7|nr:NAD(P)H-hydrate dehydratase [Glaciecola sp. XM2]MBT1449972.1 NAD(P)H-hydrate dehydratase [Glaciecola sp. XM2]
MLEKDNSPSLTQKLYRADQVRNNEKRAAEVMGIDMYALMQRAGDAVFKQAMLLLPNSDHYLVLVGIGHNAGDGYIAAVSAANAGKNVKLCAIEPDREVTGDVARARQAWLDIGGKVEHFSEKLLLKADIVIDALLGTGINGTVRNEFADVIDMLNASITPVISVDVPSGLCADTGESLGRCVQADVTVTFIGIKMGLTTGAGKQSCGTLVFEDLGVGKTFASIARSDATALDIKHFRGLAPRPVNSHKGNHGRLLCIGGNKGMSGAIRLTSEAALRSGAGMVKVFAHQDSIVQICGGRPELMVISTGLQEALEWATCVVIGPGLGTDQWAKEIFDTVMDYCQHHPKPIVFDADALNLKAVNTSFVALSDCIITPHSGEAARLLNVAIEDVESNRFNYARQCAQRYDATCVLKGAGSIVDNQKHSWVCRHGNPGMATAGMGDVLAGILGALVAQGLNTDMACQFGVSLHAKAGDLVAQQYGQRGLLASDLFETVRVLINE